MCRLLQLNDKVNEFKAIIKSGAWREIAVEWDSESGDQPLEGEQTATGVCVEDDPQCPVDDDFDMFYDDRNGFDEEYPEIDEDVAVDCQDCSQSHDDSDSEVHTDKKGRQLAT
jgi:hypothetical protein